MDVKQNGLGRVSISILSTSRQSSAEEMPPKKGKGRAKRSHPDAEVVAAEGQVNVDVNIHPAPPEEDMPAEAVQLFSFQQRPYHTQQRSCHPQRAVICRATSLFQTNQ